MIRTCEERGQTRRTLERVKLESGTERVGYSYSRGYPPPSDQFPYLFIPPKIDVTKIIYSSYKRTVLLQ